MSLPPGCHPYLPRSEINGAMAPYVRTDGWYLLRPSQSNPGQYSICVSHRGEVKNFKINCDENGMSSISSKKFRSIEDLLTGYSRNPIRSKKGNSEIYLLYPIPVDQKLQEKHIRMEQSLTIQSVGPAVSPCVTRRGGPPVPGGGGPPVPGGGGPPVPGGSSGPPVPRGGSRGRTLPPTPESFVAEVNMANAPPLPTRNSRSGSVRPLPQTPPGVNGGVPPLKRHQSAAHARPAARQSEGQEGAPLPALPPRHPRTASSSSSELQSFQPELPALPPRPKEGTRSGSSPNVQKRVQGEPPPLAPGWVEYYSQQHGRKYYHNSRTAETVWIRPVAVEESPREEVPPPVSRRAERPLQRQSVPVDESGPPVPTRQQTHSRNRNEGPPPVGAGPPVPRRQGSDEQFRKSPDSRGRGDEIAPPVPVSSRGGRGAPSYSDEASLPSLPAQQAAPALPAAPHFSSNRGPPLPPAPVAHSPIPAPVPPTPAPASVPPIPPPAPVPAAPAPTPASAPAPPPAPGPAPAPPAPPPAPVLGAGTPGSGPPPAPNMSGMGLSLAAGKSALKTAAPKKAEPKSEGRGDLLSAIRAGKSLKKVDSTDGTGTGKDNSKPAAAASGMVGALMSAISTRREAIEDSEEGEDFEDVEEDDW